MGFGSSKETPILSTDVNQMYIILDRPLYSPGDKVSGRICLSIQGKKYPGKDLILDFIGTENYKIFNGPNVIANEEAQIIRIQHPLKTWTNGEIVNGQYEIPFSFELIAYLPDSFEFSNQQSGFMANISYKFVASIPSLDRTRNPTIHSEAGVIIKTRPPAQIQPISNIEIVNANRFICCSAGGTEFKYTLEKNAYAPDENIYLIVEVDNSRCSQRVEYVKIEIKRVIAITTSNGGNVVFEEFIKKQLLGAIPGRSPAREEDKKLIDGKLAINKYATQTNPTTTQGQFIKCWFCVNITAKHAGKFTKEFTHSFTFVVYEPEFLMTNPALTVPPEWNPEKAAPVEIPIDPINHTLYPSFKTSIGTTNDGRPLNPQQPPLVWPPPPQPEMNYPNVPNLQI